MFLDVACFLIEQESSVAIALWDGSGWSGLHGLETLVNKCLVELICGEYEEEVVELKERIRMHDHLRDMGREIAATHSPCRYWSPQQILDIWRNCEVRTPVRGIDFKIFDSQCFMDTFGGTSRIGFKRLRSSLRSEILIVRGNDLTEEIASLLEDPVWLQWNGIPHMTLPSWIPLTSLTVLQSDSGDLEELWEDNVDPPLKLIELEIHLNRLQRIPPSIGRLQHLKKITLRSTGYQSCHISSLPEEFCDLQSLEHLALYCFYHLSSLPVRFGELRSLRHIMLFGFKELKKLPVSFKHLMRLECLVLASCEKLKLRSDMLENIRKLEILDLSFCMQVEKLPSQITNQVSLKTLNLYETSLRYLPNDIGLLCKLNCLSIGSNLLTSFPTSLGNLSCLTELEFDTPRLRTFPAILNSSSLTRLIIKSSQLTGVPVSLGNLSSLTKLEITCSRLTGVPDSLGNLTCLTDLSIDCPLLTSLPASLGKLSCLKYFSILTSEKCEYIPHCIWVLEHLERVHIEYSGIRGLPSGAWDHENAQLMETRTLPTPIEYLTLLDCKMLKSIRCIAGALNLRELRISGCSELNELPTFADLTLLKEFKMVGCPKLSRIEGIQHCTSLEELEVETSWELPGIQSLEKVDRLKKLSIKCHNMSAIKPCVQSMKECPCLMQIEGRVSAFVQPIINSLEFPGLTVIEWEEEFDLEDLKLYLPNFLCYLERERDEEEDDEEEEDEEGGYSEKGTYVHIAMFRQSSQFDVGCYTRSRSGKYLDFFDSRAIVVAGEEAKVVKAFYEILARLE